MKLLFTHHAQPTLDEHNPPLPVFDQKAKRWVKLPPREQQQSPWVGPAGIMGRSSQGILLKERKLGPKEMAKLNAAFAKQEKERGIVR